MELFRVISLALLACPVRSDSLADRLPQLTPLPRDQRGHAVLAALPVLLGRPIARPAFLATSLALIGSVIPLPRGNRASPPGVTH